MDFLVLSELLLVLGQGSLESRLLLNLGLLVGIEDLFGDEFIERFAGVLGEKRIGFGGVGLHKNERSVP